LIFSAIITALSKRGVLFVGAFQYTSLTNALLRRNITQFYNIQLIESSFVSIE